LKEPTKKLSENIITYDTILMVEFSNNHQKNYG